MTQQPLLSLVVPAYNEADNLPRFFEEVIPIVDGITPDWEMVFVDDGSKDDTAKLLHEFHQADKRIKLLSFSRNFGKEPALTAGLDYATGQAVIPMDADLQDPPELIPEMVAKWREGYQVVLATRNKRGEDTYAKRLTAGWFYHIIGRMSETSIPKDTGDYRLMDAQVVEAIRQMPERTRFMKGILSWVGFETTQLFYERPPRHAGTTKFRFKSLWKLALDGIFSFTTFPLKVWTYIGAVISLLSFTYAAFMILKTLFFGVDVPGYASLMTVVLFLGGIQLMSLGVIGEYIARIYSETKRRPLYLVKEKLGF